MPLQLKAERNEKLGNKKQSPLPNSALSRSTPNLREASRKSTSQAVQRQVFKQTRSNFPSPHTANTKRPPQAEKKVACFDAFFVTFPFFHMTPRGTAPNTHLEDKIHRTRSSLSRLKTCVPQTKALKTLKIISSNCTRASTHKSFCIHKLSFFFQTNKYCVNEGNLT